MRVESRIGFTCIFVALGFAFATGMCLGDMRHLGQDDLAGIAVRTDNALVALILGPLSFVGTLAGGLFIRYGAKLEQHTVDAEAKPRLRGCG